ncbi:hypothetical protein ABVT39_022238 [Epinephelus coioides]
MDVIRELQRIIEEMEKGEQHSSQMATVDQTLARVNEPNPPPSPPSSPPPVFAGLGINTQLQSAEIQGEEYGDFITLGADLHLPNLQPVNGVPTTAAVGHPAAAPPPQNISTTKVDVIEELEQYNSVPVPGLPDGQSLSFVGVLNGGVLYKVPEGHFALPVPAVPPLNTSSSKKRKREKGQSNEGPYVKKPLNAFMLFLKEHRANVDAELKGRGSAAVNTVLGQIWKSLTKEEQAKYFHQAETERVLHAQRHPEWSPSDNFVSPTCSHTTHTSSTH